MADRSPQRSKQFSNAYSAVRAVIMGTASAALLSGCVAGGLPTQDLAASLAPIGTQQVSDATAGVDSLTTKLEENSNAQTAIKTKPVPPETVGTDVQTASNTAQASPDQSAVQTAIATESKPTPAQKAVQETVAEKSEPAKPVAVAKLTPATQGDASEQAKTEPVKPAANNFFASLLAPKVTTKRASLSAPTKRKSAPVVVAKSRIKRGGGFKLPGVNQKAIFDIDEVETEEIDEPVQVASLTNLAKRGTHGLLLQHPGVKVGCFPRELVAILRNVERRFGRTPIVTSGYRSPAHNRRVRGAKKSTHVHCKGADIQVKGISKWKLAKYLRSVPGRGGVGTYCHTKSVHIDIGTKRAWNWPCRRRKRRK